MTASSNAPRDIRSKHMHNMSMSNSPQSQGRDHKQRGKPLLSWLVVVVGLACIVSAVLLYRSATPGRALVSMAMYVGLVLGGIILCGVGFFSSRRTAPDGSRDYRHAYPLFTLVALGIIAFTAGRQLFVPPTYGQYGHYRGAAPGEARRRTPRHVGQIQCNECHEDIAKLHDKDAHARVACEACHGPGFKHKKNPETKPVVDRSQAACLVCHQQLLARPASFPQIQVAKHYALVGVKDAKLACVKCHSPHEPLFMDRDLRKARLHPLVHRCRDCHAGRTNDRIPRPKNHPPIFDCAYCHKKRVADFAKRKHHKLRCSTCHVFLKETQFAGRIVRDSDPRFCLLCHRKAKFRSANAAPGIDPKKHLEDPKTACIECHSDAIHGDIPKSTPVTKPPPAAAMTRKEMQP